MSAGLEKPPERGGGDAESTRLASIAAIYRFMDAHREEHAIATMASVLGVSRSGYHAWKTRPLSGRARADEVLKKEISNLHARHRGRYGAPRIHERLREQGWRVGRKRVARLMRELGIDGVSGAGQRARRLPGRLTARRRATPPQGSPQASAGRAPGGG